MKYLIQIEKNKSANLHKKFYMKSSLTLEEHRLLLAFIRETRVYIVDYSEQNYVQPINHSSNIVNRISGEIIQYKAADANLKR